MSILIKGIKMPKTCGECRFSVDGWCYAFASNDDQPGYIKSYEKAKWCPLIKVPPHGRLIDADAFFKDVCNSIENMTKLGVGVDADFLWAKLNDALDNAPTVIPADKDGET